MVCPNVQYHGSNLRRPQLKGIQTFLDSPSIHPAMRYAEGPFQNDPFPIRIQFLTSRIYTAHVTKSTSGQLLERKLKECVNSESNPDFSLLFQERTITAEMTIGELGIRVNGLLFDQPR
jgi:hypothetical protein